MCVCVCIEALRADNIAEHELTSFAEDSVAVERVRRQFLAIPNALVEWASALFLVRKAGKCVLVPALAAHEAYAEEFRRHMRQHHCCPIGFPSVLR